MHRICLESATILQVETKELLGKVELLGKMELLGKTELLDKTVPLEMTELLKQRDLFVTGREYLAFLS